MNFFRRVMMVLGIAGAAGAILRLKGRSEPSSTRGGWKPMTPIDGEFDDPISSKK